MSAPFVEDAPLVEENQACNVGGINTSGTYLNSLITLSFEGYTTCTEAFSQSGQATLLTASGAVVASGSMYDETTASAASTGTATNIVPGNYVISYSETIISATGWENVPSFCSASGSVLTCTRTLPVRLRIPVPVPQEQLGSNNPSSKDQYPCGGDPVNCATGNLTETQTDLSVGGRGPGLRLTRSYNSLAAAVASSAGPFGYGWTGPYSAHLEINTQTETATVVQDNGSDAMFVLDTGTKEYLAPSWVQATLKQEGSNYVYTLPNQTKLEFNGEGRLTKEVDRAGNSITLSYNSEKRLETVTDGAGRTLIFSYTSGGQVESVKGPMGHTVKYAYEGGNLTSVTLAGQTSPRWRFEYATSHLLTALKDGKGNTTKTEYGTTRQVSSQTDPLKRKREFAYIGFEEGFETTITEPNGSKTIERFNRADLPTKITRAAGASIAATTEDEYDSSDDLIAVTDPDKHTTKYGYNTTGDRTSEIDANGDETKWTYDSTHDVATTTTPRGETTTIFRNARGEPEVVERPGPEGATQRTFYSYDTQGDLERTTDPGSATWTYGYDGYGDRTSEIDPEGDKRLWEFNESSQEVSTTSPRGNVAGAKPARFTTTIERDALGRPLRVSELEPSGVGKPNNTRLPTIVGVVREGQLLSASVGEWEGAASVSFAYQWKRCNLSGATCSAITGATGATYQVTGADAGNTLRVAITATNSLGSTTVSSEAAAIASPAGNASIGSFGTQGTGNAQFEHPADVVLDSKGDLWTVDEVNDRVQEFNEAGEYMQQFGSEGSGEGQLKEPSALALDSKSDVWVVDTQNNRVEEFNKVGKYLKAFGTAGSGNGQFSTPEGIAIDAHGNVWVSDTNDGRLEEFSKTGEFLKTVGTKGTGVGQIGEPEGLAIDSSGNVWVTDWHNNRVEEFNEEGTYVSEFGTLGSEPGQLSRPDAIALDAHGDLWVADIDNDRLEEFSSSGGYISSIGTQGTGPGQLELSFPVGLAINAKGDLWATDSRDSRIEEWTATAPLEVSLPLASGDILAGQTLTVTTGAWVSTPLAPTYGYQWQRCCVSGEGCANIVGATSASYLLTAADVGHTLRVLVAATNSNGTSSATSPATGAVLEVLGSPRVTQYAYDANGNVESITDPKGNKTTYTYNADNEPTKVEQANHATTETEYDAMGRITSQTDGDKHTTKYTRNALGEVTESVDPVGRATKKEYDGAGNLKTVTDAAKRTATYTYDPGNRLVEVKYSDGKTPTVKYEYDKDGNRTVMVDGTGTSKFAYDVIDRLTETQNGHGEVVKYEYDLDNKQVKITYPGGKSVTRAYDHDGRLTSVSDWAERTTKFAYDQDSNLVGITFPTTSVDEDRYAYNGADQMTEATMLKSSTTLASLAYTRDEDGQIKTTTSKGLPGAETFEDSYDTNQRLTKSGTSAYECDGASNPTKLGGGTYKYDAADELESGSSVTYHYDEVGERTSAVPASGPTTTYGYDEAGNLISAERAKEGEVAKIEDRYAYDGEGLRASQTISGTTAYFAWDTSEGLPLLLSDGSNSYVYGAGGLPIEQVTAGGTTSFMHHDAQGSTRLLTATNGTVEGASTFDGFGVLTGQTGRATTPLGYDGQYTNADTGLIYLRARSYDPATAQFISVDPFVSVTREPYGYAGDDPTRFGDRTGLGFEVELPEIVVPCTFPCVPPAVHEGLEGVAEGVGNGFESIWNTITENEGPNDEGEAELHDKEAEREQEQACNGLPPGYDPETWSKKPASRPSDPGENYYDPEGGEWRWHAPDKYHSTGHWDYKPPGKFAEWKNVYP